MKKLLFLPGFALIICLFAFKIDLEKSRELIPSYNIVESKPDSSLKADESRFAFTFLDDSGNPILKEIKMSYNGIEKNIQCDKNGKTAIITKPGKYVFKFFYTEEHYEITTDSIVIKPTFRSELNVNFESSLHPIICDKPVIYVYPKSSQSINIKLQVRDSLGFTYPVYNSGWNFVGDPDGTIHMNNKTFNYLFWEGKTEYNTNKINWEEGYVVSRDSLSTFFEEKLALMGFNSKEIADYITYWCPRMMKNEKNHIHFLFNDEFGQSAPLTITPKPDQLYRVFMLWAKDVEGNDLKPQTIPHFSRDGFTVVEWGGSELPYLQSLNLFEE